MQATPGKPSDKEEGTARAKAFEQEYKSSHPDGPYRPVETEHSPLGSGAAKSKH